MKEKSIKTLEKIERTSRKPQIFGIISVASRKIKKTTEIFFCVAAGVFIAVLGEWASLAENSRFHSIRDVLKENFIPGSEMLPNKTNNLITLIILILIALLLCYVFDANSKRNSFALGAGILTMIFSFLEPNSIKITHVESLNNNLFAYRNDITKVIDYQEKPILISQSLLQLRVYLEGKERNKEAKVIIRNQSGFVYQKILTSENDFEINVSPGRYQITVEVTGYQIKSRDVQIFTPRQINIKLVKSNIPLPLQRIQRGWQN